MGHVWLIGMMGTGKTTTGRRLAELLAVPFVDADELIAARSDSTIGEIFAAEGEEGFRARERSVIAEVAAGGSAVVAAGGGAALDPENTAVMRASGRIVLLEAATDTLVERLQGSDERPLLASDRLRDRIDELSAERRERYRIVADLVIDTSSLDADAVAARIAGA